MYSMYLDTVSTVRPDIQPSLGTPQGWHPSTARKCTSNRRNLRLQNLECLVEKSVTIKFSMFRSSFYKLMSLMSSTCFVKCSPNVSMMFPCFDIWFHAFFDSNNHWCRLLWTIPSCEFSEFQGDRATQRMGFLVASGWNRSNLKSWIFADLVVQADHKQIVYTIIDVCRLNLRKSSSTLFAQAVSNKHRVGWHPSNHWSIALRNCSRSCLSMQAKHCDPWCSAKETSTETWFQKWGRKSP